MVFMNGYPPAFITRHSKVISREGMVSEAPCKPIYIRTSFEGDDVLDLFKKRLRDAISRVYNAAKPIVLYAICRIPCHPVKMPLPLLVHSNVIDHSMCRC